MTHRSPAVSIPKQNRYPIRVLRYSFLCGCTIVLLACDGNIFDDNSVSPMGPDGSDNPNPPTNTDNGNTVTDSGTSATDGGVFLDESVVNDGGTPPGPPDFTGVDPIEGMGMLGQHAGDQNFFEGPVWRAAQNTFLFSAPFESERWAVAYPALSNASLGVSNTGNANGMYNDLGGALIVCQAGSADRISRIDGATTTTVVDSFNGGDLNGPNDVVVRSDGLIIFTDPDFQGNNPRRVFRVDPDGSNMTVLWTRDQDNGQPNGVMLSPDETILYVSDDANARVFAFDLDSTGNVSNERVFVNTSPIPDGMCRDVAGNLYVATDDGLEIFSPEGTQWGTIWNDNFDGTLPDTRFTNCTFGGNDGKTLFITGDKLSYHVSTTIPGITGPTPAAAD